jgi:hypothetical protein
MADDRSVSVGRLILVPSLITFAVTILRLVGELLNWSPKFFSREAGGGASLVGISWLVPIFAIYFSYRLVRAGDAPRSVLVLLGSAVAGVVLVMGTGKAMGAAKPGPLVQLLVFSAMSWVAAWIAYRAWPGLGKVLLAYAVAARVPVAVVMLVAMYGHWGTHYDVANPQWPAVDAWNPFLKWLAIGALPQFTIWFGYTLVFGAFFGAFTVPLARRMSASSAAPATS